MNPSMSAPIENNAVPVKSPKFDWPLWAWWLLATALGMGLVFGIPGIAAYLVLWPAAALLFPKEGRLSIATALSTILFGAAWFAVPQWLVLRRQMMLPQKTRLKDKRSINDRRANPPHYPPAGH